MNAAPTWIDAEAVGWWQAGYPNPFDHTDRWFVFRHENEMAFIAQSGNASHDSFGGEDTAYGAAEIASAIECWGASTAGLEASEEFFDALELDVKRASATGTRLQVIRAEYLLNAMRTRLAIAQAQDAPPFKSANEGRHGSTPFEDDDAEVLIIPREWA